MRQKCSRIGTRAIINHGRQHGLTDHPFCRNRSRAARGDAGRRTRMSAGRRTLSLISTWWRRRNSGEWGTPRITCGKERTRPGGVEPPTYGSEGGAVRARPLSETRHFHPPQSRHLQPPLTPPRFPTGGRFRSQLRSQLQVGQRENVGRRICQRRSRSRTTTVKLSSLAFQLTRPKTSESTNPTIGPTAIPR